ncbi:thiol reductant ABC exporter subunit CydD [Virgibacillus sp. MSJ-26]|uniref:thiol reductant ABC exporter subunit CydD n=1 Tax=Virgibacillus sp. MSJ-26 TaxID=2841522 RepID=UPI001C11902A|nr:thiol reductant ABC exporter subunit CydD [Virgibacillus sp. MSJ-26]MBU5466827.1 thiol reductant ABC exporter subunit CydD [Virgibacillus sp. MSJ-26]
MKRKKGLPSYPGSRKLYASLTILIIFETIGIIAQAYFLARAITLLFDRVPLNDTAPYIALFFLAFILRHALSHFQEYLTENYAQKTSTNLRKKLVKAYFRQGQQFIQTEGTGRLVTLAIEGMDQLKKYLEIISIRMIRTFIVPLMIVLYVFTLDKISAVILVVTVPIIIIFMILLGLAAQKMADKQYATYRVLSNHFLDSLKGLETLKYLGQSVKHVYKINKVSKRYREATVKTLRVAFLSSFALDFFTSLSIAFVAVGLGFRLIDGAMVLFPALTILLLAPEYFSPIKEVGSDFHATLDGQVAMGEIDKIIAEDEKSDMTDQVTSFTWTPSSQITLKEINVGDKGSLILKNINFSWQGTGMIGIIGESGAGKSTLINLFASFLSPTSGEFKIDEKDVNTMKNDWLKNIAYIPQHPYIFPASLADNIRFYAPEATDERVKQVIREIELEDFVNEIPEGMHQKIGEGGLTLSGGQEQRIAMARVLLSDKPIILLDEPTAHLDIETEYEVKQVMLRVFKNRLVFLATHRLHWMHHMNDIIVLDNGRVAEQGTHNQLVKKTGTYFNLQHRLKGGT